MTHLSDWKPMQRLEHGESLLIEASAGTGKTFQTEGLVLRLVCGFMDPDAAEPDPVPIEKLVIITFTRAAAAELRDRVRARLVRSRDLLVRLTDGDSLTKKEREDPLQQHLEEASQHQTAHLRSIRKALADYDQANISTIHSFCQAMLADHGLAAGLDPGGLEQVDEGELLERYAADLHAALVIRCTPGELAHLKPNGWKLDDATQELKDHGAKLSVDELIPEYSDFPADPLVAEVAARMHAALQQAVNDALAIAEAVEAWFATSEGQTLHDDLDGSSRKGFDHWKKDRLPIEALTEWIRSRGQRCHTRDVESWLGKLAKLKDTIKGFNANTTAAREFFAELYSRYRSTHAHLLAIALHGATRIVRARQKRLGLQTFNSMVRDFADALTAEERQPTQPLRDALRARFSTALVDEFQDTDNAQWEILRTVFLGSEKHRLIAVGDPKQSIYRFRGANLGVYEDAKAQMRAHGGSIYRLPKNFRSDSGVMDAFNSLFQDAPWMDSPEHPPDAAEGIFTPEGITYTTVDPKESSWKRLRLPPDAPTGSDLPLDAPFELRWLGFGTIGADVPPLRKRGKTQPALDNKDLRPMAARAAARRIDAMLQAGVEVQDSCGSWRPVRPDDFAVLTRGHHEAKTVATALRQRGISSIRRDGSSAFSGPAAGWIRTWLEAVASPRSEGPTRRLALTPLMGWTPHQLDARVRSESDEWTRLRADIQAHADTWPKQGFGRRFQRFVDRHSALQRILTTPEGNTDANDLLTILDACDAQARTQRLSPDALARWMMQQRDASTDGGENPHTRTLATDSPSVILSTVHASKGLQFPIVLVPFSWTERLTKPTEDAVIRYSDGRALRADIRHTKHPERIHSSAIADPQVREESMRLLYVALTRARHKAIVWGACVEKTTSALQRMLHTAPVTTDIASIPSLGNTIHVAAIDEPNVYEKPASEGSPGSSTTDDSESNNDPPTEPPPLQWSGAIPRTWQNASYSSLSKSAKPKDAPVVDHDDKDSISPHDDPSVQQIDAEVPSDALPEVSRHSATLDLREPTEAVLLEPVLWAGGPQGKEAGTWIHGVLEDVSFQSAEGVYTAKDRRPLAQLLADRALQDRFAPARTPAPADRSQCPHLVVTDHLDGWLTTPLNGPRLLGLPAGFDLSQLQTKNRIDELGFELRVGGGHGPTSSWDRLTERDDHIRSALQSAATGNELDPYTRSWVDRLLARRHKDSHKPVPILTRFDGFLNGKIDLVFRAGEGDEQRYYVADYKTNALSGTDEMKAANLTWAATGAHGSVPRLRRWHYTRKVMAWSMDHSAYHLQSLLYTVALHRFLDSRLDGYDPEKHLGGHLYLYLRGMEGPATLHDEGACLGVWTDRWPPSTVVAISNALQSTGGAS